MMYEIKVLKGRILTAEMRIYKIQEECGHPNVIRTPNSNTGNWCVHDDRYWYEYKCPDCCKRWIEEQ